MNERLILFKDQAKAKWNGLTNKQKMMLSGVVLFLLISLGIYIYIASQPVYTPLYNQALSKKELGEVKAELDKRQIPNRITTDGTGIEVPEKMAQDTIVQLAAQGIPSEAGINMDIFSGTGSLGVTDRQFAVMKKDALQQEVTKMLEKVDGVRGAQVMLSLAEESALGITDTPEKATASVIVDVAPGTRLNQDQIKALYYLVSRSVPKLPVENITIMNQFSEPLELEANDSPNTLTAFEDQEKIKKEAERQISQNLYNMFGTIMGRDKVIVQTSLKMNFAREDREEHLVEAPDKENNAGLIISSQKISETYSGQGAPPGGAAGTGQNEVPSYPGANAAGTQNQYEKLDDVVNREVNRITRNVKEAPYKIEDITINLGVEPPNGQPMDPQTLENIRTVLRNVVRVTLSQQGVNLTQQELDQHISVFERPFSGKIVADNTSSLSPALLYGVGAVALLALGAVAFLVMRRRRQAKEQEEEIPDLPPAQPFEIPELEYAQEGDEYVVRKQLEKLARSNPDEFVTLLRTWLAED